MGMKYDDYSIDLTAHIDIADALQIIGVYDSAENENALTSMTMSPFWDSLVDEFNDLLRRRLSDGTAAARFVWAYLEDVPLDEDGEHLAEDCDIPVLGFYPVGTDREEIWHDIEERFGVSVAWLMGEPVNPDGSGLD